jgi:hypothetical protein
MLSFGEIRRCSMPVCTYVKIVHYAYSFLPVSFIIYILYTMLRSSRWVLLTLYCILSIVLSHWRAPYDLPLEARATLDLDHPGVALMTEK